MAERSRSATPAEVFRHMETSYSPRSAGRPRSIHEGFSVLDFELRFLALLAASTVRAAGRAPALVGRSPAPASGLPICGASDSSWRIV